MTRKRPERRGDLSGLLGSVQELTRPSDSDTLSVPLTQIAPYAGQPRRSFADADLKALAESIRQKGILQPLLVRPTADGNGYEIAAGERRYRASLLAGLTEVPVLVRDFTDEQMLEVGLVENLQRENLSVLDEVEGKLRLIALRLGATLPEARQRLIGNLRNEEPGDTAVFSEIFAMTGRETWQSFAKNKVRILQWPEEVLAAMRERGLAYSLAAVVAAAPADLRPGLLEQALAGATAQQLRASLAGQGSQSGTSGLEQEVNGVTRQLGRSRWIRGLDRKQQAELQKWLAARPAWMKQAGEPEAPTPTDEPVVWVD